MTHSPKTREEVLRAVEMVEAITGRTTSVWCFSPHLNDALEILCERTRTLLQQEELKQYQDPPNT
jgi:hypothetical protein